MEIYRLDVKPNGQTGPGESRDVSGYADKVIQVVGGQGSYDIEVSLDGTNFVSVQTVTAPGIYSLSHACARVRINANENTTAPTVLIGGNAL